MALGGIARAYQANSGRALCVWGDAGWGSIVRADRYQHGHFSDQLVQACVDMITEWQPNPVPEWVTAIPSVEESQDCSGFC